MCNGQIAGSPITARTEGKQKPIIEKHGFSDFSDVFMISALEHDGIDEIKVKHLNIIKQTHQHTTHTFFFQQYLLKNAKPRKWMFSSKSWTDRTPENIITDTVRAKFLDFLEQELPYELIVEMEYFEEKPDKIIAHVVVTCTTERKMKLIAGAGDGRLMQITDFTKDNLVHAFKKHVNLSISLRAAKIK